MEQQDCEEVRSLRLTRRQALRLLDLIENPPPRNAKFIQAMARYQALKYRIETE